MNKVKARHASRKNYNTKIPSHSRRLRTRLHVMGGTDKCIHSLSAHEELTLPYVNDADEPRERKITVSYALPCQVAHKATTKNPKHKDATGRTW